MSQTPSSMLDLGTPLPPVHLVDARDGAKVDLTALAAGKKGSSFSSSATIARTSFTFGESSSMPRLTTRSIAVSWSQRSTRTTSRRTRATDRRRWSDSPSPKGGGFRFCSTRRSRSRAPFVRRAPLISTSSTLVCASLTAGNSTMSPLERQARHRGAICGRRSGSRLSGARLAASQHPSVGCNIKWRTAPRPAAGSAT